MKDEVIINNNESSRVCHELAKKIIDIRHKARERKRKFAFEKSWTDVSFLTNINSLFLYRYYYTLYAIISKLLSSRSLWRLHCSQSLIALHSIMMHVNRNSAVQCYRLGWWDVESGFDCQSIPTCSDEKWGLWRKLKVPAVFILSLMFA